MKNKAVLAARILLGLPFAAISLVHFLGLFEPPPPEGQAGELLSAMVGSGYLFTLVKLVELVCGLLLVLGLWVPLALIILAPVVLNIVLFHLFLDPSGLPLGVILLALGIFLAYSYRSSFAPVLARRAELRNAR